MSVLEKTAEALVHGPPPPQDRFAIHRPALIIEARPTLGRRFSRASGAVALLLTGLAFALAMLVDGPRASHVVLATLASLAAVWRLVGLFERNILLLRDDSLELLGAWGKRVIRFRDLRGAKLDLSALDGGLHLEVQFRDGRKQRVLSGVGTVEGQAIVEHIVRSIEGRSVGTNPYRMTIAAPVRLAVADAVRSDARLAHTFAGPTAGGEEGEEESGSGPMEETLP